MAAVVASWRRYRGREVLPKELPLARIPAGPEGSEASARSLWREMRVLAFCRFCYECT